MTTQTNDYKGFSLFNDIDDSSLRNRNRAVVLANIAENNAKNRLISANGLSLIMGYFNNLPKEQREELIPEFTQHMKERGFELQTRAA
jgi:hypothetical protein